jgi:hypothetical protein
MAKTEGDPFAGIQKSMMRTTVVCCSPQDSFNLLVAMAL